MMIVMKEEATPDQIEAVVKRVEAVGARTHVSQGELVTVIGAIGDREHVANLGLEGFPGVDHLTPITKPYKLSSLQFLILVLTVNNLTAPSPAAQLRLNIGLVFF